VMVAFKAMHEDIDSFGGLAYIKGGDGRVVKRGDALQGAEQALPCVMGCNLAPWTGSLVLKQSCLCAAEPQKSHDGEGFDMDAPPDVFAAVGDGKDRGAKSLGDVLKASKRVFVCGLALDFCVLDTCINAVDAGLAPQQVHMVLDAARAAHIPGVGAFGSGFLSDPAGVLAKLKGSSIKTTSIEHITRVPPCARRLLKMAFPNALGPIGLTAAPRLQLKLDSGRYTVTKGLSERLLDMQTFQGQCAEKATLPAHWPGAPEEAVSLCWAYPVEGVVDIRREYQSAFLSLSVNPELQFATNGGYLLLDSGGDVVATQAVSTETEFMRLTFGPQREWRSVFTDQLKTANRFQPVTLPFMITAGAKEFCWINPGEQLKAGPEAWTPSPHGAFLYLFADGESKWFPAETCTPGHSAPASLSRAVPKANVFV